MILIKRKRSLLSFLSPLLVSTYAKSDGRPALPPDGNLPVVTKKSVLKTLSNSSSGNIPAPGVWSALTLNAALTIK
jgi:hypothetical protein